MADIKNDNYIAIQGFMVKDLELTGNELIAYALIYGFSQDGESQFRGSLSYVAEWLNCSKTTAFNILNNLAEDGFIQKTDKFINGVKLCDYSAIKPTDEELMKIKERKQKRKDEEKNKRCSKNLNTRSKKLNKGVQKVGTHNINNNIKDKNNLNSASATHDSDFEFEILQKVAKLTDDETIIEAIRYYLEKYKRFTGKNHPNVSKSALNVIIDNIETVLQDEWDDVVNEDGLERMISRHFKTDYGQDIDYNIVHFGSEKILEYQARNVGLITGWRD